MGRIMNKDVVHQSSPYLRTEMAVRLTNKQMSKDVRLFLASCKFAKALGVAPSLSRETSKLKRFASKIYISKLIVTYAALFVWQELGRIKLYMEKKRPNYVVLMLDTVLIFSLLLSVISWLLFALARKRVWRDFVVQLLNLEQALRSCGLKRSAAADRICSSIIRMILLTFVTVGINLVENLLQAHEGMHEEKSYIDLRIWIVYNLFMVITVSNTAELMVVRYDFLKKLLIEQVLVPVEACRRIREINVIFSKMKRLVDKYNEIVYWPLFFVPANAVLMITQCFNYCFFRNDNQLDLSWKFLATNVGISLNWVILTIVMVMACDSVEKSGRKFTETCYLLQEGMAKSELRCELKYLAEYSEKLCPTFSAAGFYKVNQRVLAALFSIVTTYSIISIQFNIAH